MYRSDISGARPRRDDWYETAQVCLNGHAITQFATSSPEQKRDYCPQCGAKTITECPSCGTTIKGYYQQTNVLGGMTKYVVPRFCDGCGKPYPGTEATIEAAQELIQELELSQEEKKELAGTINDLVTDGPKTQVASMRFKRLVTKAGQGMLQVF